MSAIRRSNSVIQNDTGTNAAFAASYTVIALPVGAVAVSFAGNTATVDAGHGFAVGDKVLIWDGTTATFVADVLTAVTATTLVWATATPTIAAGDRLCNLGPDTSSSATPAYDASPMVVYSDADGATAISNSLVTTDATGNYGYWTRGDGRNWELIRTSAGVVAAVVQGWGGVGGRYNVADFGGIFQVAIDAAASFSGSFDVVDTATTNYSGAGFIIKKNVTVTLSGIQYEITSTVTNSNGVANVTAGIIIYNAAHLIGKGTDLNVGTRILRGNGLNVDLVSSYTVSSTRTLWWHFSSVENLHLEGNSANNTAGAGLRVEDMGECSRIQDIQSRDFGPSIGDGILIEGESASGASISNLHLVKNRYGFNGDNLRKTVTINGISGDDNDTLLRVEGKSSLSLTVIGMKCETSIAGRNEPAILLDGDTLGDEPVLVMVGGTVAASQSSTDLIKIQTTNWRVFLQGLYVDTAQYTNGINDALNTVTVPVADVNKMPLLLYSADVNNNSMLVARGHQVFNNNVRLVWKNIAGTEVGIMRGAASTDTTDISALTAAGIRLMTTGFAATVATVKATNMNMSGASISSNIVTFADADATPSVATGNIFKTDATGTTTITNFSSSTAGQVITVLAESACTLTHGASTIILDGSVNFVMAATDTFIAVYDGSNWREISRTVMA